MHGSSLEGQRAIKGGSKPGWHWKVSKDKVAAIKEMKAAGKKIAHIARITGLSRPTIYVVLRGAA
jgi:DNA invertase Pin-like site-specific DNA recombinase